MWHTTEILELSFAVVNFDTFEIIWKSGEFTPKRRNALLSALDKGYITMISDLESIF